VEAPARRAILTRFSRKNHTFFSSSS
jgi:hypothetical protein